MEKAEAGGRGDPEAVRRGRRLPHRRARRRHREARPDARAVQRRPTSQQQMRVRGVFDPTGCSTRPRCFRSTGGWRRERASSSPGAARLERGTQDNDPGFCRVTGLIRAVRDDERHHDLAHPRTNRMPAPSSPRRQRGARRSAWSAAARRRRSAVRRRLRRRCRPPRSRHHALRAGGAGDRRARRHAARRGRARRWPRRARNWPSSRWITAPLLGTTGEPTIGARCGGEPLRPAPHHGRRGARQPDRRALRQRAGRGRSSPAGG